MAEPTISRIGLSTIIQMGALIVTISASWFIMDGRTRVNEERNAAIEISIKEFDQRLRLLEQEQARNDERFDSVIALLTRIDARLERLENLKK